jgi:hypothetical protein
MGEYTTFMVGKQGEAKGVSTHPTELRQVVMPISYLSRSDYLSRTTIILLGFRLQAHDNDIRLQHQKQFMPKGIA